MVTSVMEELIMQIPNAEKMLSVDGVGLVTVAGFISEVGDISRFKTRNRSRSMLDLNW